MTEWLSTAQLNEDTDIENKLVDIEAKEESGTNRKSSMETYMLLHIE